MSRDLGGGYQLRAAGVGDARTLARHRDHGKTSVTLNATLYGRALYEAHGFEPTNQMRLRSDSAG